MAATALRGAAAVVSPGEAAERLLDCVCDALSTIDRPVCKCYQTMGTPVVGRCCECEDTDVEGSGELSIHFRRLFDADPSTLLEVQRVRPCKGGTVAAQYRLVLARCFPTLDEDGELPDPEDLITAAEEQHLDVDAMWQALACCTGLDLRIDSITSDLSPRGGCSFLYADVTVAIRVPALPASGSF